MIKSKQAIEIIDNKIQTVRESSLSKKVKRVLISNYSDMKVSKIFKVNIPDNMNPDIKLFIFHNVINFKKLIDSYK